jgi:hypothetical protein
MFAEIEYQAMLKLPQEVIDAFDLKEGDIVNFEAGDNGTVILTFPKNTDVDLDLSEKDTFSLMQMAHERNITLNALVEDILTKYIASVAPDA